MNHHLLLKHSAVPLKLVPQKMLKVNNPLHEETPTVEAVKKWSGDESDESTMEEFSGDDEESGDDDEQRQRAKAKPG